MTDAPRYRLVGYDIGTAPDENGGWVHWTDHEAIVARLTAENESMKGRAEAAEARVAELEAPPAITALRDREAAIVAAAFEAATTARSIWLQFGPMGEVESVIDEPSDGHSRFVSFAAIRALIPPADLAAKIGGE